ncbi:MAG: PDZ domain-containing protein, partial [Planctomycetota bacterium]
MSTRLPAALSFPLFTAIAIAATLLWNGPLTAVAQESSAATSDNESQDSSGESTDESSVADSTASNSEGEGEEESEATNEYATHLLGMTLSNNANGDANNEEGSAGATADDRPNETPGALVVDIDPLSPAWNAGVRTQDIVVSFSGFDAEDESFEVFINAAREVVKARKEGDTIAITIVRDGEEQDLRIEERSAEVTID